MGVAAIGLYAILAQYVASRRKEIGLRIALGAMSRDVLGLVARRVAPIVLLGLLVGIDRARRSVALARELAVRGLDARPDHDCDSAAAVLAMSLLAAMVPVLHAISVDPARTLRED